VAVLVLPVEARGVALVRRVMPPLPSWPEETGVLLDPAAVRELRVRSGSDGTLLIFATAPAVSRDALEAFRPSAEASELVVVDGPRDDVVFPLDAEVLVERFAAARD
jgi:hypothetical protein